MSTVRRLDRLEARYPRRGAARPRLDLSGWTDEEVDQLAAIAERVKSGQPLGPTEQAAIVRIEAAAEERKATTA